MSNLSKVDGGGKISIKKGANLTIKGKNVMRSIQLKPTEFVEFKRLANQIALWFTYNLSKGIYLVTASDIALEELGY